VYERFTDRAHKVLQLANQEAQRFNHEYIGTEHILLGLVKQRAGVAVQVLKNLKIDLWRIRQQVEQIVQAGPDMVTMGILPKTPRAKKVIEHAIEESRRLNRDHVGTEHLLVGLLRAEEGVAAVILNNLGLRLETVRNEISFLLLPLEKGYEDPFAEISEIPVQVPVSGIEHLPDKARRVSAIFDQLIEQLRELKEEAIAKQDFERAAYVRDKEHWITRAKAEFVCLWPKSP